MVLSKILHMGEGRRLRELQALAAAVTAREPDVEGLSDAELAARTTMFKERLDGGASLDDVLVDAYATVRETAKRVLGQRPFDVQLIGGVALHQGDIAEMKTGEGKTLTSTMPIYLNALAGKGVHAVTVNPYLASRDSEWMGRVYRFLGLSVGLVYAQQGKPEKRVAYAADITYGTNNEFGFDFLRDHMVLRKEDMVQRGHFYAIVDEVDSILVDEARTPLIISGPAEMATEWYTVFAKRIVPRLQPDVHYEVDEAKRTVAVTEEGVHRVEELLGVENLYESVNTPLIHHLQNAIRAKELFLNDREYIVEHGEVLIVDEHTGRTLPGRRYSEGLHQAIEAKEGVKIKEENQTLATITLQNYFRTYEKLSGMTGTAKTEEVEFSHIYDMGVVQIPTNRPPQRMDQPDLIYKTYAAKIDAVVEDVVERQEKGQPVLLGTISVEKSEELSKRLRLRGIDHEVLNAKNHFREAEIIAQAGRIGSVTVATNMAGRGVDIMLGGNPEALASKEAKRAVGPEAQPDEEGNVDQAAYEAEYQRAYDELLERCKEQCKEEQEQVRELGGLYVLGTERHDSRRIDNQLRGRSGRQGDPGESRFYLSLEDDLMRLFNASAVESIMNRLKIPDDVPIEHKMVTNAVARAQRQVESRNFEIRKNVLKYDDVMNAQRKVIYAERTLVLEGEDDKVEEIAQDFVEDAVRNLCTLYAPAGVFPEDWDVDQLQERLAKLFPVELDLEAMGVLSAGKNAHGVLVEQLVDAAVEAYEAREKELSPEVMRQVERRVILSVVDRVWREHLYEMDHLRDGIGLRAVGQRDPLVEYQREAYEAFVDMQARIKEEAAGYFFNLPVRREEPPPQRSGAPAEPTPGGPSANGGGNGKAAPKGAVRRPALREDGPKQPMPAQLSYTSSATTGASRSGSTYTVMAGGTVASSGGAAPAPAAAAPGAPPKAGAGQRETGSARQAAEQAAKTQGTVRNEDKVGRNDPCPCGSGQKYKRCHGA